LNRVDQTHPLIEVTEHLREHARSQRVAVVFDLDSTLFNVSPRTQAILRRLGGDESFRAQFAAEAVVLSNIEVLPSDWGVRQALERTQIVGSQELFVAIRDYWRKHFFSSGDLLEDHIYPSANEYVRLVQSLGAEIFYLTGRPEGSMREGTLRALAHWGFPLVSDSHLIMKPSEVQTDESFKAVELQKMSEMGFDYIWFFENEPVIIEQVRAMLPQIRIVFVNSVHAGRTTAPTDLPSIRASYVEGLPVSRRE
jgi:hypothetical protein